MASLRTELFFSAVLCLTGCSETKRSAPPSPTVTAMTETSLFDFSALPFRAKEPKSLGAYRGQVLLVVNIASNCGFTPQMKPLGALEKSYAGKPFHVVGFLSDDFGRQAGTDDEVVACDLKYDAGFAQFAIVHVKKGPEQAPIFQWLTSRPGLDADVKWNFAKWLIGKDGQVVKRWASDTAPDSAEVLAAIEAELGRS